MGIQKVIAGFLVDSDSHKGKYLVRCLKTGDSIHEKYVCTCPDYNYKRRECKHIIEVKANE